MISEGRQSVLDRTFVRIFASARMGLAAGFVVLGPTVATANTAVSRIHVANHGVDSGTCGTAAAPCRSITRAIANAKPRDILLVGPGRYSRDLDGDTVYGEAAIGEESAPAECSCMVLVDKSVEIQSTAGAAATLLDANNPDIDVVRITVPFVQFGMLAPGCDAKADNGPDGFLLTGGRAGLIVEADGVVVDGNIAARNGRGYSLIGTGLVVRGNQAFRNRDHGLYVGGGESRLTNNISMDNGRGFFVRGSTQRIVGNTATGNRADGIRTEGHGHVITDNIIAANGTGLVFGGEAHDVRRNLVVGNAAFGIEAYGGANVVSNNIYGNGVGTAGALANCGIYNASRGNIEAVWNFWGGARGPGDEPADRVCTQAGSSTRSVPFATAELGPYPLGPVNVANNGVDSATCGTPAEPCRTITRAIANQPSLATIVVGPGIYGDLNRDWDFLDAGDEPYVSTNRRALALESRAGAAATVVTTGIGLAHPDTRVGAPQRGFTLLPPPATYGISVSEGPAEVNHNVALGMGIYSMGSDATFNRNLVVDASEGFFLQAREQRLNGNLVLTSDIGFFVESVGVRATANVATANSLAGILARSTVMEVRDNMAVGSERGIWLDYGGAYDVRGNVAAGNLRGGIVSTFTQQVAIAGNDVYGNGELPDVYAVPQWQTNCGISTWPVLEDNAANFFGSRQGPGANPADAFCALDPTLSSFRPAPLSLHAVASPFAELKRRCPAAE